MSAPTPKHLTTSLKKERSVNPSDWDAKIDYWAKRIESQLGPKVICTGGDIRECCHIIEAAASSPSSSNDASPSQQQQPTTSISTSYYKDWQRVLDELVKRSVFLSLEEFEKIYDERKQEGFGTWLMNRVGWFGGSATDYSGPPSTYGSKTLHSQDPLLKKYIYMSLLKEICINWINSVYSAATTHSDLIVPPSKIAQYLETQLKKSTPSSQQQEESSALVTPNDAITQNFINFMHHEGPATIIRMKHNKCALKFANDSSFRGTEKIASSHLGIAQLKETLFNLDKQSAELEDRIKEATFRIRKDIQHQKKSKAKWEMGRKRMFENALDRRRASIRNLEEILTSIQTAETDMQVMDALKSGTTSLRVLTADMGDVEGGLEEMAEALADYKDIQDVLDSTFIGDEDEMNDEEVLKDLEKLSMEEEKAKKAADSASSASADANQPKKETKEQSPSDKSTTADASFAPVPPVDEISFSLKILQFQKDKLDAEVKKLSEGSDNVPKAMRDYLKELDMAYKLTKLKQKKRKRNIGQQLQTLRKKQQNFQEKASSQESSSSEPVNPPYAHFAQLLQEEIEQILEKHPELKSENSGEESFSQNKKVDQSNTPAKESFEERNNSEKEPVAEAAA